MVPYGFGFSLRVCVSGCVCVGVCVCDVHKPLKEKDREAYPSFDSNVVRNSHGTQTVMVDIPHT